MSMPIIFRKQLPAKTKDILHSLQERFTAIYDDSKELRSMVDSKWDQSSIATVNRINERSSMGLSRVNQMLYAYSTNDLESLRALKASLISCTNNLIHEMNKLPDIQKKYNYETKAYTEFKTSCDAIAALDC